MKFNTKHRLSALRELFLQDMVIFFGPANFFSAPARFFGLILPSISMGHLYHGYVSHNQGGTQNQHFLGTLPKLRFSWSHVGALGFSCHERFPCWEWPVFLLTKCCCCKQTGWHLRMFGFLPCIAFRKGCTLNGNWWKFHVFVALHMHCLVELTCFFHPGHIL